MNIDSIISKAITEKIPCYFISPHLDDAVFSAGRMLVSLSGKTKITIVTVFTEGSFPPYTLSAKAFLKKSGGYHNAPDMFKERRAEDAAVCSLLMANRVHLDLIDALFRKKRKINGKEKFIDKFVPELNYLYPVYRLHVVSGKIAKGDDDTLQKVENKLRAIKECSDRGLVFCPLGVGCHVDHVIVRNICQKVFSNLIFWDDHPYNLKANKENMIDAKFSLGFLENTAFAGKKRIMSFYKSQVNPISLREAECAPETYYASSGDIRDFNGF